MNPEVFLSRAREGDPAAGPILVSIYGRGLFTYLRRIAGNLSEADLEILAEESIEAAVANIDRYSARLGSFEGWLRGFARIRLLERSRAGVLEWLGGDIPDFVASQLNHPGVESEESELRRVRDVERLKVAIKSLGEADQLIIALRDVNGLPYDAIAERLDASPDACRQRHVRAIDRLRVAFAAVDSAQESSRVPHEEDRHV